MQEQGWFAVEQVHPLPMPARRQHGTGLVFVLHATTFRGVKEKSGRNAMSQFLSLGTFQNQEKDNC
jgi:hypothetical protein